MFLNTMIHRAGNSSNSTGDALFDTLQFASQTLVIADIVLPVQGIASTFRASGRGWKRPACCLCRPHTGHIRAFLTREFLQNSH